jgi:hypothetical protein
MRSNNEGIRYALSATIVMNSGGTVVRRWTVPVAIRTASARSRRGFRVGGLMRSAQRLAIDGQECDVDVAEHVIEGE